MLRSVSTETDDCSPLCSHQANSSSYPLWDDKRALRNAIQSPIQWIHLPINCNSFQSTQAITSGCSSVVGW